MFTGLVQDVGTVTRIARRHDEAELAVDSSLGPFTLGESIAVNGTCLTVTDFDDKGFSAFASAETLAVSGLGELSGGRKVNLERAVRAGEPLGGHLVTGHVDARVALVERSPRGAAERWTVSLPDAPALARQIAPKGSVALDGVSLTVNAIHDDRFELMIIPHTLGRTALADLRAGARLNLETDVLAKYVARQLGREGGGVDMELLLRSGFVR
jgi:riboflavin synthase